MLVPGDDVVVLCVVLLLLDVLPPPAGEGFTIVVLCSVGEAAAPAAGVTSVRCSQAPRSAALARMQIIFFIYEVGRPVTGQGGIAAALRSGLT